jgi:DNA-binding transcriptional ArsR family regulator
LLILRQGRSNAARESGNPRQKVHKQSKASELASRCQLTQQTISSHLAKLVVGGLLLGKYGERYRYFRLASPEVGHAIEMLQAIAPRPYMECLEMGASGGSPKPQYCRPQLC